MQAVSGMLSSKKVEIRESIKQNNFETFNYNLLTERQKDLVVKAIARDSKEYAEKLDNPIRLKDSIYRDYIRRIIDIVVSGAALIVTLPVNLLLAVITYFDVGRPIFYKQERVGKNGEVFVMIKFRNMTNETNENDVLLMPAERVTRWGRFVRRTSLDELLNFWCIFIGKMTLIGPRPLPVKYYQRYSREHNQRHMVKPGLECPFHTDKLIGNGWKKRFENDIWYVKNLSFKTDVIMMWKLLKKIFSKEERRKSAFGQTSEFIGYDSEGNIITSDNLPKRYLYEAVKEETDKEDGI